MRYLKFIILFLGFVGMMIYLTATGSEEYEEKNKILKNGIIFEGIVTDIKISNNHGFGILTINVLDSTVKNFSKKLDKGIFPYQIEGNQAEIYLPIFLQRQIGDSVKLVSDKQIIYYKGKKSKDEGEVYIITETTDIDYVEKNTMFK